MVHIKLHSGLGNQLFQYSFAQYVSVKLGKYSFLSVNAKTKYKLHYFRLSFPWKLLALNNYLRRTNNYLLKRLCWHYEVLTQSVSDVSFSLVSIKDHCTYIGYFQDKHIAEALRPKLLKQFAVKNRYVRNFKQRYPFFGKDKILVVHIRLTDYECLVTEVNGKEVKWLMPVNWYQKLIKQERDSHDHLLVISDDTERAKKILQLTGKNVLYSDADEITDFLSLVYANTCIISNSSFAWWGAFLNEVPGKRIFAPVNWVGYNAGFEYPKGIMTKEFIWV